MKLEEIDQLLRRAFKVSELQIEDDSAKHRLHPQSKGKGGHFKLRIVSNDFENMDLISRHRKIYETLQMKNPNQIHALAIEAWTEKEWNQKNK